MGLFNTVIPETIDIDDIITFLEKHKLRLVNFVTPFQLSVASEKFKKSVTSDSRALRSEDKIKSKKKQVSSSNSNKKRSFDFSSLKAKK